MYRYLNSENGFSFEIPENKLAIVEHSVWDGINNFPIIRDNQTFYFDNMGYIIEDIILKSGDQVVFTPNTNVSEIAWIELFINTVIDDNSVFQFLFEISNDNTSYIVENDFFVSTGIKHECGNINIQSGEINTTVSEPGLLNNLSHFPVGTLFEISDNTGCNNNFSAKIFGYQINSN